MSETEAKTHKYTAESLYQPQELVEDSEGRVYYPYLPSDNLKKAVELAITLDRPLLLEGEPGCGKTRLAYSVAYEFTQRYLKGEKDKNGKPGWWPFYIWNVKSTTRARDGLYTFDAVARLRDAQMLGAGFDKLQQYLEKDEYDRLLVYLKDRKKYRQFGPLGYALNQEYDDKEKWKKQLRPIVLIDEIDKADSDFGNDLLIELEDFRFDIPETGESINLVKDKPNSRDKPKPIIFITSNREKPLPEPLLRRCIYFFVDFPDEDELAEIIKIRFGQEAEEKKELVEAAIAKFYDIRDLLDNPPRSRPPGTSELIDFLSALFGYEDVDSAIEALKNLSTNPALLGTLLKTQSDQERFRKQP